MTEFVHMDGVEETENGLMCHSGGRVFEISNDSRQLCEQYTRVMGYYRPVSEFNRGKRQEQRERVLYSPEAVS